VKVGDGFRLTAEGVKPAAGNAGNAALVPPGTLAARIAVCLTATPKMPKQIKRELGIPAKTMIFGYLKRLVAAGRAVRTDQGYATALSPGDQAEAAGGTSTQGVRPLGHSVTRLLHWMGSRNWTPDEAKKVLKAFGLENVNE